MASFIFSKRSRLLLHDLAILHLDNLPGWKSGCGRSMVETGNDGSMHCCTDNRQVVGQPEQLRADKWRIQNVWSVHPGECHSALKKEAVKCKKHDITDGLWGHRAEWHTLGTEKQTLSYVLLSFNCQLDIGQSHLRGDHQLRTCLDQSGLAGSVLSVSWWRRAQSIVGSIFQRQAVLNWM